MINTMLKKWLKYNTQIWLKYNIQI